MENYIRCPTCTGEVLNDFSFAGQAVACPHCGNTMQMPFAPQYPNQAWQQPRPPVAHTVIHTQYRGPEKNSGISAVLSFIFPGVGQIYNGHIGKGIFYMCLFVVFLVLTFALIGFPLLLILWVWGIYDAYNSAEQINRKANWHR